MYYDNKKKESPTPIYFIFIHWSPPPPFMGGVEPSGVGPSVRSIIFYRYSQYNLFYTILYYTILYYTELVVGFLYNV